MTTNDIARFGYTPQLQRSVRLIDQIGYGLVFMVPIAPFAIFGAVFQASGGMPVAAYAAGLVVLAFTAASYQQMVRAFPLSGSVYNYAGRGIGASVGFITGWMINLDYLLVPALLYLVAGIALNAALPTVPIWIWIIAFVAVNTIVNLRGIRMSMTVTKIMIAGELAVLGAFLGVGGYAIAQGAKFSFAPLFQPSAFTVSLIASAVSIAVLSFLGFDGIAMLVEESKGGARDVGRAMRWALVLAGVLFIAQVWVAGLLVPDPAALIADGDPNGTAFYDVAGIAGGQWLRQTTSIATAIAWGIADTLVAQIAVSRLLFAMARDRQLPSFLAKVSTSRLVPANAIMFVAVISIALSLYMNFRPDGVALLASLINMGAMTAFVLLHLSVIWHYIGRQHSRDLWRHLLVPSIGMATLGYVIYSANILSQIVGALWLIAGLLVLIGLYLFGRKPTLPSETVKADEMAML